MHILIAMLFSAGAAAVDCTSFYYVKRPVATSLVMHEYVAAQGTGGWRVFGLPKPGGDLAFVGDPMNLPKLQLLGRACGRDAVTARTRAKVISDRQARRYRRWLPYLARMIATPLLGKPCRRAAQRVRVGIRPYLQSE